MASPALLKPFTLKDITLRNRVAVPPMCQYIATDGMPNDGHHVHYGALSRGGAGVVVVEATAVAPEGRITPGCLGLWNDEQKEAFIPVVKAIKDGGAVPGIQIAHAGRKASANIPWEGDDHIPESDPRSWQTIAPSAIAFGAHLPRTPKAMTTDDIATVKQQFADAARRALEAGFEWIELHFAHGYLAQSFFSEYTNQRTDAYGGSLENRCRFLIETLAEVKKVWPEHLPLTARFGVIEFDGRDEETFANSLYLIKRLKKEGLDLLSVSMGFTIPDVHIPWGPGFMAPYAERVRKEAGIPVTTAWGFEVPAVAEQAVAEERLDLVSVGRAHLANPHWTYAAAKALRADRAAWVLPPSYARWLERYSLGQF
ncbi:NADH:flavin oxidoreductase/NADH oxidase [Acetobacter thailandicus]|uniref:NADH:flavin oxidoreductase/NADH oxidase n=1 Tax=Acetobacter thailandicus TaxID=1502842 RepID=A0ABT3QCA6_9PROT|nr:NADH:flavin oxidoreductase/NADH oxidase [Acetobacter thailandicus]MBS0961107.1 NADH:flavin oxidoreductase/NADH oxidase [Acetobacter thailandicus]MBS0981012.1 NADH:flavin oxidoreductase/NADH oxidase [Acetobacter thailandicus]MCX2562906.1 NADH:flavin oxidoreductase/NADH oxidase [Acetobacter thailandicus]NHN95690.1 NADH:flavin oxidoreductase/NADH oxidase [Acetobacter thailandicus]